VPAIVDRMLGMSEFDFDLFTIGGGSGGVRGARIAASLGARVALAEERYLGGTCVNVGCVPKKLLVYASEYGAGFDDARAFGWDSGPRTFDWQRLIANKDAEIERLNGVYAKLLDGAGVTRIVGRARLLDAHTVEVAGKRHTAEHILIAVGGWPRMPKFEGAELGITSNEVFHLKRLPERVLICGGGYIAVEFAGIFHGLGVEVTQLYRGELFLRGFDTDVRKTLAEEMRKRSIDLRFNSNIKRLERRGEAIDATLSDDSHVECDQVLIAIGRVPLTADLGLDEAGVQVGDNGHILVDEVSRTTADNIYAVGDVTGRIELTPVALAEGMAVAHTLFGDSDGDSTPDHDMVPSAVFSQPPVASVGLTDEQAREKHGDVDVYRSSFRPMRHTISGRDERTMMKLIVEPNSDRVLGLHMVGPDAGEIVQGFAVALKMGATKAQLDATIGIHPTAAEELVTMRTKASD